MPRSADGLDVELLRNVYAPTARRLDDAAGLEARDAIISAAKSDLSKMTPEAAKARLVDVCRQLEGHQIADVKKLVKTLAPRKLREVASQVVEEQLTRTQTEQNAIRGYTFGVTRPNAAYYLKFNSLLRSMSAAEKRAALDDRSANPQAACTHLEGYGEVKPKDVVYCSAILKRALWKSPNYSGRVFRGGALDPEQLTAMQEALGRKTKVFLLEPQFVSTSQTRETAKRYRRNVLYLVTLRPGFGNSAVDIPSAFAEQEVLVAEGAYFQVLKIKEKEIKVSKPRGKLKTVVPRRKYFSISVQQVNRADVDAAGAGARVF